VDTIARAPSAARLTWPLGIIFGLIALVGLLWMNFAGSNRLVPFEALGACALLLAIMRLFGRGDPVARAGAFARVSPLAIVALGLLLRIGFAAVYAPTPSSDAAAYMHLADALAAGREYVQPQGRAYWPPGLPLAFAPFRLVLGGAATIVFNLVLFALTAVTAFALARRVAGRSAAGLTLLLLALWPNYVLSVVLLEKEALVVLLWAAALLFYLRAGDRSGSGGLMQAALAGAALGYAGLVQPAGLLMPGLFALFTLSTERLRARPLLRVLVMGVCAVLTVLPWTARNYVVLHHFVPVSTAGGVNFYMVSLPDSDGRWNKTGDHTGLALDKDEVARDALGFNLGWRNIAAHTAHYLGTVVRKPFYIYGSDNKIAYWIFVRGDIDAPLALQICTALSNVFYAAIVLLTCIGLLGWRRRARREPALLLLVATLFYPIFSNSLFEAVERHRYGVLTVMAIFAAMGIERLRARGHTGAPDERSTSLAA